MSSKYFTKNGEWFFLEEDLAICGLSAWAVDQLGEVSFVELPPLGQTVQQDQPVLTMEAVKAASDYYCPLGGTVVEVNTQLSQEPGLLNQDPEGKGWLFKLKVSSPIPSDLMDGHQFSQWTQDSHG